MKCKLCKHWVLDDWAAKWKHLVKRHPEVAIQRLIPLILDPGLAFETGRRLARWLHG